MIIKIITFLLNVTVNKKIVIKCIKPNFINNYFGVILPGLWPKIYFKRQYFDCYKLCAKEKQKKYLTELQTPPPVKIKNFTAENDHDISCQSQEATNKFIKIQNDSRIARNLFAD